MICDFRALFSPDSVIIMTPDLPIIRRKSQRRRERLSDMNISNDFGDNPSKNRQYFEMESIRIQERYAALTEIKHECEYILKEKVGNVKRDRSC